MILKSLFRFALLTLLILSCGGSEKNLLPLESFSFPIDLVSNEENSILYVISSNFDMGYRYGNVKGISINRLKNFLLNPCRDKCGEFKDVIINSGVSIGDYAGISVYYNYKIFVPLRKDNKIAVIEANESGLLSCGNGEKILGDCDENHLISTDFGEPFSLAFKNIGNCIYVSFLKSGSVICIDKDRYLLPYKLFSDFSNGYEIGGVKDIDIRGDGLLVSAYAYMMSGRNLIPLSYDFKGSRYTVFLDFTDQIGNAYQESVKVSALRKRFFVSLREPDLLLSIDYEIYKDGTFIIVDYRMIPLYRYPSRLYVEYSKSTGRELLFISLIDEDRIFVYDAEGLIFLTEVNEGLDGPYAVKLIGIEGIEYLFVSNFENSTVSVYRFMPQKNSFEYLLSIGKPRPKEKGEY